VVCAWCGDFYDKLEAVMHLLEDEGERPVSELGEPKLSAQSVS
jgi:hypothetical protein